MTFEEVADRLAIRELIDAYAHYADRRDCEGPMALFTEDTRSLVFMDAKASTPSETITRRADLKLVFEDLGCMRRRHTSVETRGGSRARE